MHARLVVLALAASTWAACVPKTAVINGTRVPRPSLGYSDNRYFALRHRFAYPEARGPSSGLWSYGGRIDGYVCGLDIVFETDYYGKFLDVNGFLRTNTPGAHHRSARFYVRDGKHGREISGTIGGKVIPTELYLTPDSLRGRIGTRHYELGELDAAADELRGTMRYNSYLGDRTVTFVARGIRELWEMPPADQAVITPLLLSCLEGPIGGSGVQVQPLIVVDFRTAAAQAAAGVPPPGTEESSAP